MAFNLKKVLRALLFSSSRPLSVKDVQAAFTRFHEQASLPASEGDETTAAQAADAAGEPGPESAPQAVPEGVSIPALQESAPEVDPLALAPENPDLYQEVPSLVTASQIREAMDQVAEEVRGLDLDLRLVEGSGGYQLVTEPRFAKWIRVLRNEPPPVRLTQSALETLAVVAYRQPVTRTEIENIRGVSAEAGVNKLLERELIYIVGRADLPGRPLQYGTTDKFLEFVGVRSLEELPASDVLSNRQIDEWLQKTSSARPPTDAEMGLPLEVGEGESPNFEEVSVEHAPATPADQAPSQEAPTAESQPS